MEEQRLSFGVMLSYLYRALEGVEDPPLKPIEYARPLDGIHLP